MRLRRRIRTILTWGTLLLLAVVIGGGFFAYTYVTDNETLRSAISEAAPKYLPNSAVDAGRVRVRPFAGKIILDNVSIRQFENGIPKLVGLSPWIQISYDAWAMLDGRFDLKDIVVAQPKLRLRRREDGTWNFVGLLASPWPMPPSETTPPVRIENGTVELVDETDGPEAPATAILRDVSVQVASGDLHGTPIRFEGTAKGDLYDRIKIVGSFDRSTGRVLLSGELNRLVLSKTLSDRLPVEARRIFQRAGLQGGEADLTLRSLTYDHKARIPLHYDAVATLRSGVWKCPNLPFPINELDATVAIKDGVATIERSKGRDGTTSLRATGTVGLLDPAKAPFHVGLEIDDLELERVHEWSIDTFDKTARDIWNDFRPKGRVDLSIDVTRGVTAGPIDWSVGVGCRDVAIVYKEFAYPLEHISGEMICRQDQITLDLHTQYVGGKPLTARGTIDNPGPNSVVNLDFTAESLPVDKALLTAMPPDVRQVVESFKPSGAIQGKAHITRTPPKSPQADPKGEIAIDADLDLKPGSEITWEGLKYPVRDLTGRLEIHPTSWIFTDMRGTHGQATITGEGRVDRLGKDQYKVGIHVNANNILFESQLRDALQDAWKKTWDTLNPTGASDVDVAINLEPGKPDRYHLEITPRPQTNLRLKFKGVSVDDDDARGSREVEMPMEEVTGRFVYDDGIVTMTDGRFSFHSSPVRFTRGEVRVFDSGQFTLKVDDLSIKDFKIDARLRKLMPTLMDKFARRLDDGKSFLIRTNLALGWSGKPGEPATCAWNNATVVFNDNTIVGIPLHHIQGEISSLRGAYDGRALDVHGILKLASVNLFEIQMTELESPIEVVADKARLTNIRGTLLGGELGGNIEIGLEATPKYEAHLRLEKANLQSLARFQPGKQSVRGMVSAKLDLSGLGPDPHSIQGVGEAHVTEGDLGKLPAFLRVVNLLNLAPTTKTAFDKADVWFKIRNGETTFNPIEFFGYAFSLHGRGTLDVGGDLDVKLRVLYGRDTWHIFLVSDAIREASGQIFVIRVLGTPTNPIFKPEPLPQAAEFVKSFGGERRALRASREDQRRGRTLKPATP
jgi:hypothetical protein